MSPWATKAARCRRVDRLTVPMDRRCSGMDRNRVWWPSVVVARAVTAGSAGQGPGLIAHYESSADRQHDGGTPGSSRADETTAVVERGGEAKRLKDDRDPSTSPGSDSIASCFFSPGQRGRNGIPLRERSESITGCLPTGDSSCTSYLSAPETSAGLRPRNALPSRMQSSLALKASLYLVPASGR